MFEVINQTTKTQRKGFVIFIKPTIYNRIAEEIIFPNDKAVKPIKIFLTPNGVIIEKCMIIYGQKRKAITKISDYCVEGAFADAVGLFMEELKSALFKNVYDQAKAERQKKTGYNQ